MHWAEVLEKLGFSFWQLVVLLLVLLFRVELRNLFGRIAGLKIAGSEITLSGKDDAIEVLKSLKSQLAEKGEVSSLIEERIRNRLILALASIKRTTTTLWPMLEDISEGQSLESYVRRDTFEKISGDLAILKSAGVFDHSVNPEGPEQYGVLRIDIHNASRDLVDLIRDVKKYY